MKHYDTVQGSGLSPHGRGNHERHHHQAPHRGSIPARAGEPGPGPFRAHRHGVYPRTGGGTGKTVHPKPLSQGLSPHGRGNPRLDPARCPGRGSIPARAGEPVVRQLWTLPPQVYPRTGGGTIEPRRCRRQTRGLSPHGRGNRDRHDEQVPRLGSIPARAGEPRSRPRFRQTPWVYPRTGGGTEADRILQIHAYGLSPHGRGNHARVDPDPRSGGSIPARAGEPRVAPRRADRDGVYPRTGGGTTTTTPRARSGSGLSPHGRGNPWCPLAAVPGSGSIPARAGEPVPPAPRPTSWGVYPRTGGGTS